MGFGYPMTICDIPRTIHDLPSVHNWKTFAFIIVELIIEDNTWFYSIVGNNEAYFDLNVFFKYSNFKRLKKSPRVQQFHFMFQKLIVWHGFTLKFVVDSLLFEGKNVRIF